MFLMTVSCFANGVIDDAQCSIGGMSIGDDEQKLLQLHGKPLYTSGGGLDKYYKYGPGEEGGYFVHFYKGKAIEVEVIFDHAEQARVNWPSFSTPAGLVVGMPEHTITDLYGETDNCRKNEYSTHNNYTYWYTSPNKVDMCINTKDGAVYRFKIRILNYEETAEEEELAEINDEIREYFEYLLQAKRDYPEEYQEHLKEMKESGHLGYYREFCKYLEERGESE